MHGFCPSGLRDKQYLVMVSKFGTILLLAVVLQMTGASSLFTCDGKISQLGRICISTNILKLIRGMLVKARMSGGFLPLVYPSLEYLNTLF